MAPADVLDEGAESAEPGEKQYHPDQQREHHQEPIASSAPAATPAETSVVAVSVAIVEVVETLIARLPPRAP